MWYEIQQVKEVGTEGLEGEKKRRKLTSHTHIYLYTIWTEKEVVGGWQIDYLKVWCGIKSTPQKCCLNNTTPQHSTLEDDAQNKNLKSQ